LQGHCIIAASRSQDDSSSRLMSHFLKFQVYGPSRDVLISIFTNVLSSAFSKMSDGVRRLVPAIARSTVDVVWDMHENVSLDTGSFSVFNAHMVARVIEALFSLDSSDHDSRNTVLHMWLNELYSSVGDFLVLKDDGLLLKESISSRLKSNFNTSDILDSASQPIIFVQVIQFRSSTSNRASSLFAAVPKSGSCGQRTWLLKPFGVKKFQTLIRILFLFKTVKRFLIKLKMRNHFPSAKFHCQSF